VPVFFEWLTINGIIKQEVEEKKEGCQNTEWDAGLLLPSNKLGPLMTTAVSVSWNRDGNLQL
jgi:hypothetical protein